jgi:hypothetical protein
MVRGSEGAVSVGAVRGEDAGVVWMEISPAAGPLQPERLRRAVEEVLAQVPLIQSRHRRALAASASTSKEGFALAEAWIAFHRRLCETRYSPAIAALTADEVPVGEAVDAAALDAATVDAAAAVAVRLSEAHTDLMRAIRSTPESRQDDPQTVAAGRLACWRLLCGHDGYLRAAVARSLTLAVGAGGAQTVQLAALIADHVVAEQMIAEHWAVGMSSAALTSALSDWARYDQQLRDLIELAVLDPMVALPRPTAPPPLPPDQAALDGVRAAVAAAKRESPALVARCRAVLGELDGQDVPTRRTRERLLRLWGRYDDQLTDLDGWLVDARGGRVNARLLHAELALAARLRDELVAVLDGHGTPRAASAKAIELPPTAGRGGTHLPGPAPPPAASRAVGWLPTPAPVNAEPIEVYTQTGREPHLCVRDGVPTPELFLAATTLSGRPDPAAGEYLLRIRVEPGAAVPLAALPDRLASRAGLPTVPGAFLLPADWLGRARIIAGGRSDGQDWPPRLAELDAPLFICCSGARHGVDGLPEEVVTWPSTRLAAGAYALVPPGRVAIDDPWLVLHRRRPPMRTDRWLLRVHVEPGRAIDVPAVALHLATFPQVNSIATRWAAAGIRLVLPAVSFAAATVTQVWVPGAGGWRRHRHREVPLASLGPAA